MQRIDTPSAAQNRFGPGKHGFTDGDILAGVPTTRLDAAWFNAMQEEIAHVIESAGTALDATRFDQLWTAIKLACHPPGQIVITAGLTALPGTLLCDGAAVSRDTYAALFAVIGTLYGAGDGSTTFNVPRMVDDTVIVHTSDRDKVGSFTEGALLSHGHTATAVAVANHVHTVTVSAAGGHTHGASADQQGSHAHDGTTDTTGAHVHQQAGGTVYNGGNNVVMSYQGASQPHLYGDANVTLSAGAHAHGLTTTTAGLHAHGITVNPVGDHTHPASEQPAGGHGHTVSVATTGGLYNLAAGLRMRYCIVV